MAKPLRETTRHGAAFEFYVALGQSRSLEQVAHQFGVSPQAVHGWSSAFKWQNRLAQREEIVKAKLADKAVEDEATMRHRQLTIARAIQVTVANSITAKDLRVTARDFVEAAKLERLITGKSTDRSEVAFGATVAAELMATLMAVVERVVGTACPHCKAPLDTRAKLADGFDEAARGMASA